MLKNKILKVSGSLLFIFSVIFFNSNVRADLTELAVITGTVVDGALKPISNTTVVVQVVASKFGPPSTQPDPVAFWGQRQLVKTNVNGGYTAFLAVPGGVNPKNLYAWLNVAKLEGAPTYASVRRLIPLAPLPATGGYKIYTSDFSLPTLNALYGTAYGVFVQGVLKDQENGERLRGAELSFTVGSRLLLSLKTDSEGFYAGVIPIQFASQTITYNYGVKTEGGITYVAQTGQVTLNSGMSWQKDVLLARAATQKAVVGRITDSTGKPIPNAVVHMYASTTPMGSGVWWYNESVADLFGRYEARVDYLTTPTGLPLYVTISTGFNSYSLVTYPPKSVDVTNQLKTQNIIQYDLSL